MALLVGFGAQAQMHNPVSWSTSVKKVGAQEYELIMTAQIEPGWHLYSQNIPDGGPVPTTFTFNTANNTIQVDGKTQEEKGFTTIDKVYGMKIKIFEEKTVFKQRVKLLSNTVKKITGTVRYMVCNDVNCIPPTTTALNFKL